MVNELELVAVAPATLRAMSNAQLQNLHDDFARGWELHQLGAGLPEGLSREEFLNRFLFVVEEFNRRKIDRPSAGRLDELLRESSHQRSMKDRDPEFLVKRLKQGRQTITLSGANRSGIQDNEWILVSERLKPDQPILAWAVVSFTQEEKTIPNVAALGGRAAGLGTVNREKFEERDGPFYVLRFKLIRALDPPVELKAPPPGRRFGGVLDLAKARLKEARPIDGLVLVQDAAARVLDGTKEAVVKSRKLDIIDREMFLVSSDDVLGIIELSEPRQVGITEFRKLEDVHRVTEEERKRDWPDARTLWIYPIIRFEEFVSARKLARPPGEEMVIKNVAEKLQEQELREAFHLRDTHWVPVPSSGSCPATHPNKLKFPGTDDLRCFTASAAQAVRMREQETPKISNDVLNLREKDFPNGRCGLCRYFVEPTTCKILEGPVAEELVCDGFQGIEENFPSYEVKDENWLDFVKGMMKEQPYQHIVIGGHLTPEGPIVIIRDTFKPKPHIFSLTKDFHIGHTTREHHWTQEEVDRLIQEGMEKTQTREAVVKLEFDNFFEVLNGQAKDLGNERPTNLEPLLDLPRLAIIQEDRSINQNRAEVLRNAKPEDVEARAREIVERMKNPNLVVIVGQAIGMVENRTIFQDKVGFRWEQNEQESFSEGIRPAFGSTGGKKYLAPTIVRLIPDHTKYVEAFIGGGAVFFAKKRSESEVINDKNGDIAHAYRFIQSVNDERLNALGKKPVNFLRATFFSLRDSKPEGPLARFHRFLYLNAFSFGKDMATTVTDENASFGPLTNRINRLPKVAERLKDVSILNEDFRSVIRRHDGPKTFFYFDPPYPDQQNNLKTDLTNESIREALRGIRGKFILSLPDTPGVRKAFKGLSIRTVLVRGTLEMRAEHRDKELLIANFPFKSTTQWIGESVQDGPGLCQQEDEGADLAEGIRPAFGSPGGKKLLATTIVRYIPDHNKYIEPFIGSGTVLLKKKPSPLEIINDKDSDIMAAFRFMKGMSDGEINKLRTLPMTGDRSLFERLQQSASGTDPLKRFHRTLYLHQFSFGNTCARYAPSREDQPQYSLEHKVQRLPRIRERLKNVTMYCSDFLRIIRQHDGKDSFFYLDPPYPEQQSELKTDLTNESIRDSIRGLRGKFILSLPDTPAVRKVFKEFQIRPVSVKRTFNRDSEHTDQELLIANFPFKSTTQWLGESDQGSDRLDASVKIVTAGAILNLDLWPMDQIEARDLCRRFHEANPGSEVTIDLARNGQHWGREGCFSMQPNSIPEKRERILGARVATLFRNLRGIVGNLEPGQEKMIEPRGEGPDIFAIAIESEGDAPSRILRLGAIEMAEAERMAKEMAEANPKFRIVIAKAVGKLEGQEIFQAVAEFRTQESDIICVTDIGDQGED